MNKYCITRWDPITMGNNTFPVPIIYVKPDTRLLDFSKANEDVILVEISGTGTIYDGKKIPGILSRSRDVPNYRPNYFDKTNAYVVVLNSAWHGYPLPDKLGEFTVSGLKSAPDSKKVDTMKGFNVYTPKNGYTDHGKHSSSSSDGMDTNQIFGVFIGLFGIIAVIFVYTGNSRKKNSRR